MRREADWSTRYQATVVPDRQGRWTYAVQAWSDPLATWRHAVQTKAAAGWSAADLANDLETGARLLERVLTRPQQRYAGADQGGDRGAARRRAVGRRTDRPGPVRPSSGR